MPTAAEINASIVRSRERALGGQGVIVRTADGRLTGNTAPRAGQHSPVAGKQANHTNN